MCCLFTLLASGGNDVEANVRVERRRRPSDDAFPAVRQETAITIQSDLLLSQIATFWVPVCRRQGPIGGLNFEQAPDNYAALIFNFSAKY